jgi:hypothetical protein
MVDEKEGHYEEEGEYHFSDDQVNYDVEPESSKAAPASAFTKEAFLEKLKQHRRKILGLISLIVSIGVVYKILVPSSTTPATDFNQATTKAIKPATVTKVKSTTVTQSVTTPASPPVAMQPSVAAENKPVSPPASVQQSQAPAAAIASAPPSVVAANPQTNPMQPPLTSEVPAQVAVNAQPASLPSTQVVVTATPPMDTQIKDRITALEQQNTAMMNLLQTEYAQKIADTETQANAVRGKMEELTKRVNRMEASLNQMIQLLQGTNKSQASVMSSAQAFMPNAVARPGEPRMIYSVQAIIPGRAWLKSESGDTVTVAEGDYLKKYGRVTKIDPYDGIVSIDTGNKVITLSYGLDGE